MLVHLPQISMKLGGNPDDDIINVVFLGERAVPGKQLQQTIVNGGEIIIEHSLKHPVHNFL
ncbi:hypothetical protein D3C75_915850 [compost metagenome]